MANRYPDHSDDEAPRSRCSSRSDRESDSDADRRKAAARATQMYSFYEDTIHAVVFTQSQGLSYGEAKNLEYESRNKLITEIGVDELFNYSGFIGQSNFDLGSSGGPLAYMRNNVLVRYSGT